MEIYKLKADVENYKWVTKQPFRDIEFLDEYLGLSMKKGWKPLTLEYINESGDEDMKFGDFPNFVPGFSVVSEEAYKALEPVISNETEFLEVSVKDEKRRFYLMNVTLVLDCLDFDNSNIVRFDDGRIMMVKKHYFLENRVKDNIIFRLYGDERDVFVTKKFIETVEKHKLQGFEFVETPEKYDNIFADILEKKKR